jgi:hypothetical protein
MSVEVPIRDRKRDEHDSEMFAYLADFKASETFGEGQEHSFLDIPFNRTCYLDEFRRRTQLLPSTGVPLFVQND